MFDAELANLKVKLKDMDIVSCHFMEDKTIELYHSPPPLKFTSLCCLRY
jgi:hypothetical protein